MSEARARLVAQIEFNEWTPDGHLRGQVLLGYGMIKRRGRAPPMDDTLVIFCLIAAFVWIQMLTPSKAHEPQQKESAATGSLRKRD